MRLQTIFFTVEYGYIIIADAVSKNIYQISRKQFGTYVAYIDVSNPPPTHLRASMLGYTSITILSFIYSFPETEDSVATD